MITRFKHRLFRSEKGQAAALGAMLIMALIVFVAFAVNAGKLVNDRIRLQNTVDLAAYAAAATEAKYLNDMKRWNDDIVKDAMETRQFLKAHSIISDPLSMCIGRICNACAVNTATAMVTKIRAFEAMARTKRTQIDMLNRRAMGSAEQGAKQTAERNYAGTQNKTKLLNKRSKLMELEVAKIEFSYGVWCYELTPSPVPVPYGKNDTQVDRSEEVEAWYFKDGQSVKDSFAAIGVEDVSPGNPLMDWASNSAKVFSGKSGQQCGAGGTPDQTTGRCPITTYAAAKPYFGKLGIIATGSKRDNSIMMQIETYEVMPNCKGPPCIASATAMQTAYNTYQNNQFKTYKVRMVGLFENSQTANLDNQTNWEQKMKCYPGACVDKMRH